ncbi:ABC transporter substrate-binding protein [Microbulbifer sp. CAU 1566]|uniref:ABC transporter substrate-binding protein n=1 Tax=Microbulbifer sp. CAU 1566 TaxID=2933269 RepID=UPI002004675D|nr:ABC transporter substrate-binding protein [Microbulbifer sp. CAU 1566]MCK7598559.1 ABC transporter substrate-binding protein [Microbulbifer sp. CAU 1566]
MNKGRKKEVERRPSIAILVAVLAVTLLPALVPAPVFAQARIASLNLCMDQMLLQWVDPEKIVSVTWLSGEKHYRRAPLPEHLYLNRAQAEELLPLKPDLVLTGQYGAQRASQRLEQLGFRVVRIPDAYNLAQLQQQLVSLQQALGELPGLQQEQGKLQTLLAQVPEAGNRNPGALILSANNITYGDGMLEHELLTRAGFTNLAAQQGIQQLGRVSLEQVIDAQPELLVFYGGEQDFAIAHLAERHPVLRDYIEAGRVYRLPQELGFCPALAVVDVLQQLTDKRKEIVGQP